MKYWILSASLWLAPALAGTSTNSWTLRYTEYGQWITERIERAEDGWPEIASRIVNVDSRNFKENVPMGPGEELRGSASDELWAATNKWDLSWEDKFAHWIASEVDVDFFQKYKISTDCADVEYALRFIFARNHGLEMAVRLKGTGDYFTHRSVRSSWRGLPSALNWYEDQKFLAALNYMLPMTFTHTLMKDSYPVAVNAQTMKPGTFHLELHGSSGHTQVIYRSQSENPNQLLPFLIFQSTTPRMVRRLMPDGFWQFAQGIPNERGLMRMRWPDFSSGKPKLVEAGAMPYYSQEQFKKEFFRDGVTNFYEEVYLRLNPNLRMDQVLLEGVRSLKGLFESRKSAVEQGFTFCSVNPCEPGSGNYDGWSTPTRDARILEVIGLIETLKFRMGAIDSVEKMMREPFLELQGEKFNLLNFIAAWQGKSFSSDPRDVPARRWGVSAEGMKLWLRNVFGELSEQREKIISKKEDATLIDRSFAQAANLSRYYCAQASSKNCQEVARFMEGESAELGGEKLNYRQWIERIPWFVSLSHDKVRRWGAHAKEFRFLRVSDKNPTLTNSGFQLSRYSWGWRVVRAERGGEVFVRQEVVPGPVTILEDEPTVVWAQGTKINVDLLSGAARTQLSVNFTPTDITSFGSAFVVADLKSGKFAIGESRQGQRRWIEQGTGTWLSGDFSNTMPGFLRHKVFSYGTPQGSKIWDLSGPQPKSYVVKSQLAHTAFVNSDHYIGFRGGILLLKKSGQVVTRPEATRVMQCQSSGHSCIVNVLEGAANYRFYEVTKAGEFLPKFDFGPGYLSIDAEFVQEWNGGTIYKTYRWTENGLEIVTPLSDEELIHGILGEFVFAKTKSGHTRVRRGDSEIFKGSGMLSGFSYSSENEAYFEMFDLSNGRVLLRSTKDPKRLIGNQMLMTRPLNTSRWLTGYQTYSGLWIF